MKICSRKQKCLHADGPELEFSDFGILRSSKDGFQYRCKVCSREAIKRFKQNNKGKVSQQSKEYSLKNKARISEHAKQYRKKNKERLLQQEKEYRKNNPGKIKKSQDIYAARNRDKIAASQREYKLNNPEKIAMAKKKYADNNKDKIAQRRKGYRQNNLDKCAAQAANRRAAKVNRTPEWANLNKIETLYWVARALTERTGIKWVVDHKIPLLGKNVSGFHMEGNLQVITESRNLVKSNKFIPIVGIP